MTRRVPRKTVFAALALLGLTGAARADWHDQIAPADVDRLAHLSDAREDALQQEIWDVLTRRFPELSIGQTV